MKPLLRNQASEPLTELLAACARIEAHFHGTLEGDAINRDLRDIRDFAQELEQAADRAHGLGMGAFRHLVEQALHLVVNGERAPGGDETWSEWASRAERELREEAE